MMAKAAPASKTSVRTPTLFDKCFRFEDAERICQAGVYSFFRVVDSAQDPEVVIGGRRMIMLGSNNYLGLTNDPRVKEAAIEAVRKYGTGCAGSRFLNGTLDLHVRLEERLAEFMRQEAAVTFATGFQVNLGAISCLVGKGDSVYLEDPQEKKARGWYAAWGIRFPAKSQWWIELGAALPATNHAYVCIVVDRKGFPGFRKLTSLIPSGWAESSTGEELVVGQPLSAFPSTSDEMTDAVGDWIAAKINEVKPALLEIRSKKW